jgi:DNA repair protein RadC
LTIKELPQSERPYEKLELYGEKSLSNAELLAIIIKTGTKEYTSVDIAREILKLNEMYDETSLSFLRA